MQSAGMVQMLQAGLNDPGQHELAGFGSDQANEAMAHAETHAGLRQLTVLRPDRKQIIQHLNLPVYLSYYILRQ